MNATRRDLEAQFNRVVQKGWLGWFQREAKRARTTTAHLLAIGSRETNLKNIKGDFRGGRYHGFGVMQVDIGTDANYARTWTPENVEPSIVRGVDIYLSKVADTGRGVGSRLSVRSRSFVGAPVEADDIRRISTAAYNCGRWAYYHFSRGQNVDSTTTGKDYSRDVYDRAVTFADILEERGLERMAINTELRLQGKYARRSHVEQFNFGDIIAARFKAPVGEAQEADDELLAATYGRDVDDDEINDLLAGLGDSSSTAEDPAGSNGQALSLPSNNEDPLASSVGSLEPGAAGSPDASGEGEFTQTVRETTPTGDGGMKSVEASVTTTAGDAPNAEPSFLVKVEDWKNWVLGKLKWVWGVGITGNISQATAFVTAAVNDPDRSHIYLAIGAGLFIIIAAIGLLITLGLVGLLIWNRREISHYITESFRSRMDPNLKNIGLEFETK